MSEELAFIAAVLANRDDDAPRLVYADWLEERGDPRFEFLRVECKFSHLAEDSPLRQKFANRLYELSSELDPDWAALVRRFPLPDSIELLLSNLEDDLAGGLNYVVSMSVYRVPHVSDVPLQTYVSVALGRSAVVGRLVDVPVETILKDVDDCVRYRGTAGHGPPRGKLRSRAFKRQVEGLLDYVKVSTEKAKRVAGFSLRSGHPFYPVFWDFAYIFEKPLCAVVLIGSSSD